MLYGCTVNSVTNVKGNLAQTVVLSGKTEHVTFASNKIYCKTSPCENAAEVCLLLEEVYGLSGCNVKEESKVTSPSNVSS